MQSEDDMALGLKPDAESRETRMAGSCWWVRLMVISNSSLYRKVQMFASPQACRATERSYLTPSSLSSHLALFYWWTNLQWGDKGRQGFFHKCTYQSPTSSPTLVWLTAQLFGILQASESPALRGCTCTTHTCPNTCLPLAFATYVHGHRWELVHMLN